MHETKIYPSFKNSIKLLEMSTTTLWVQSYIFVLTYIKEARALRVNKKRNIRLYFIKLKNPYIDCLVFTYT